MTFLCFYSNGSVIPRVLIKIDAQTQISQRQLVEFMNETLKSGMLGKYQADPTSIELTGINFCLILFAVKPHHVIFPVSLHHSSQFTNPPPPLRLCSILMIPLIGCQLSVVPPPLYSLSDNRSPHRPP